MRPPERKSDRAPAQRVAGAHLEPFDPALPARDIYSDRDGDLWTGSGDTGLSQLTRPVGGQRSGHTGLDTAWSRSRAVCAMAIAEKFKKFAELLEHGKTAVDILLSLGVGKALQALLLQVTKIPPIWVTRIWWFAAAGTMALLMFTGKKRRPSAQSAVQSGSSPLATAHRYPRFAVWLIEGDEENRMT
jgi:hypothetical protein